MPLRLRGCELPHVVYEPRHIKRRLWGNLDKFAKQMIVLVFNLARGRREYAAAYIGFY